MIDLKAIRERTYEATPGPWYPGRWMDRATVQDAGHNDMIDVERLKVRTTAKEDAAFIAHARSDVPALLDLVDAMTGALLRAAETCPCGAGCGVDHAPSCQVDAVLTRVGYPDQASRDAERARRKFEADKARMADAMKVVEFARMGDTSAQKILEADGVDWRAPPPVEIPETKR